MRVVVGHALGSKAERCGIDVARLFRKARPVDGAAVEARRSAGLKAAAAQAEFLQRLAQQNCVGLAGTSRGVLLLAAVDQSVQKSSCGDDDSLCAHSTAVAKAYAEYAAMRVLSSQFSVFSRIKTFTR